MATYGQYCPIARASEIVADRWTPLLVRELLYGVRHFTELERGLPGISRSLLVRRLNALSRVGVIERRVAPSVRPEYVLTDRGRSLEEVVDALGTWGATWLLDGELRPDELDPKLLLWFMHRRVDLDALPDGRTVVRFDFDGYRYSIWLVLERPKPAVCLTNPGFDEALILSGDVARFWRAWFGHETFGQIIADRAVRIDGPANLVRAFPGWFKLSTFAPVVRAAQERRSG